MQMLLKMGYRLGSGLGLDGTGRPDIIPMTLKEDRMGLGKREIDENMLSNALRQRESSRVRKDLPGRPRRNAYCAR